MLSTYILSSSLSLCIESNSIKREREEKAHVKIQNIDDYSVEGGVGIGTHWGFRGVDKTLIS